MPLLKRGEIAEDVWSFVPDDQELPAEGAVLVSLGRLLSGPDRLPVGSQPVGVRLSNTDDPCLLAPYLDRLDLVELNFPKFTDGRAFSQAQLLRRRLGYTGEIRATGQVLPDQLRLMIRSGIDAMVMDDHAAKAVDDARVHGFSECYQAASDRSDTVFVKRARKSGNTAQ